MVLYPNHITGWRKWWLGEEGLISPNTGQVWDHPTMRASCDVFSHSAPHADCQCGLWATYQPPELRKGTEAWVVGLVAARGQVFLYEEGFRAQEAQVLQLVLRSEHKELTHRAARLYQAQIIEPHSTYSCPVPSRARVSSGNSSARAEEG